MTAPGKLADVCVHQLHIGSTGMIAGVSHPECIPRRVGDRQLRSLLSEISKDSRKGAGATRKNCLKLWLISFLKYLNATVCASVIIAAALFSMFLVDNVQAQQSFQTSDLFYIVAVPFLTCVTVGGAMRGVKQGLYVVLPTLILSIILSTILASLPVILGEIQDPIIANLIVLEALHTDVWWIFPMLFSMFPGVAIGGLLAGPTYSRSSDNLQF